MSHVTLELTALPPQDVIDQIEAVKVLAAIDNNVQITIELSGLELLGLFEGSAATADKPKEKPKSKPVAAAKEAEDEDEDDQEAEPEKASTSSRFRRTKEETEAGLSTAQAKAFRKSKLSIEEYLADQEEDDDEDEDAASATDTDDSSDDDDDDADVEVDSDDSDEDDTSDEAETPSVTPAQLIDLAKKAVGFPGLTSEERRPHLNRVLKKYKVKKFSEIATDELENAKADLEAVITKFKKLVEDKS